MRKSVTKAVQVLISAHRNGQLSERDLQEARILLLYQLTEQQLFVDHLSLCEKIQLQPVFSLQEGVCILGEMTNEQQAHYMRIERDRLRGLVNDFITLTSYVKNIENPTLSTDQARDYAESLVSQLGVDVASCRKMDNNVVAATDRFTAGKDERFSA